ncbi:ETC complex I subunit conserved region-domain-containing protein [Sphaerosporella brunnea]|uniref:NADH dehydrogenase [ubiquinone] iron-sulfur protein 4, mitochondrial n=1 Tax=Sphaerosporella brunnea TaxID=1250544 RepID=A0A5J5EZX9_9PEZI|nr:ETC complex I subunit conserved region-domain-containing protein [Sphaerosporella brunnea]
MSLFRTSSRLVFARLPIAATASRAPIVAIRHKSTDAVNTKDAVVARTKEPHAVAVATHEGVPEIPVDTATSAYSPIPKYPEIHADDVLNAAFISGAPLDLQSRTVRIYKPAKPATQSGDWNTRRWRMDWDVLLRGHRWENPLMGWQSSGDSMQGTSLSFKSKEDAIFFAEKQGYQWFVQEPNTREFRVKSYAENFLHSPGKLKIIRTK